MIYPMGHEDGTVLPALRLQAGGEVCSCQWSGTAPWFVSLNHD